MQRVMVEQFVAFGDGASTPLLFPAGEFAREAARERNPLFPRSAHLLPWESSGRDGLLEREGRGALSVCVECV